MKDKDSVLIFEAYRSSHKILKETYMDEVRRFIDELNSTYKKFGFRFDSDRPERDPSFKNFKRVVEFLYDGPVEMATAPSEFLDNININGISFSILDFDESKEVKYDEYYNSYLEKLKTIHQDFDNYDEQDAKWGNYDLDAMERDRAANAWPEDEPMDYRTRREIEHSDRLDIASKMDPDQAAEFRRGA